LEERTELLIFRKWHLYRALCD